MRRDKLNSWVRNRLIDIFNSAGMTIPVFAKKTKISERQIHKILKGETESTSVENLVNWSLVCGVHPSTFFRGLNPEVLNEGVESEIQRLVDLFSRAMLVDRKRAALAAILLSIFDDAA